MGVRCRNGYRKITFRVLENYLLGTEKLPSGCCKIAFWVLENYLLDTCPGYNVKLCPVVLPLLLSLGRLDDRKGIRSIKKILLRNLGSERRFRVPPAASSFSERRFRVPPAASSFSEWRSRVPPAASSFSHWTSPARA